MTAICGVLSLREPELASRKQLDTLLTALHHRGGKARESFVEPSAGIAMGQVFSGGFTSPDETSAPAWYEDEDIVLAVDGFVYNAAELAGDRLAAYGNHAVAAVVEQFRQHPDTFAEDLDGSFALALWRRRERTLTLVTDFMGGRPLYYFVDEARQLVLFATELKALLRHPALPREVDTLALGIYLVYGVVLTPFSILRGVRKLMPAESVTFAFPDPPRSKSYWRAHAVETGPDELEYWLPRVREAITAAVLKVSRGTGRVGVFFSGGADSSAVAAALTGSASEVLAVTGSYSGEAGDDPYWGEQIARHLGIPQRQVSITADDVTPELLSMLLHAFNEPISTATRAVTTHFLSVAAHAAGFDSCLSGNFSEAIFGGDQILLEAQRDIRDGKLQTADEIFARFFLDGIFTLDQVSKLLIDAPGNLEDTLRRIVDVYGAMAPSDDLRDRIVYPYHIQSGTAQVAAFYEQITPLSGVEVQSPFRDLALFEFARQIPSHFKSGASVKESKALILQSFRSAMPPGAIDRRKQVYPALAWNKGPFAKLEPFILRGVEALKATGLFRVEFIDSVMKRYHARGKKKDVEHVWCLFVLYAWYQIHIADGEILDLA